MLNISFGLLQLIFCQYSASFGYCLLLRQLILFVKCGAIMAIHVFYVINVYVIVYMSADGMLNNSDPSIGY